MHNKYKTFKIERLDPISASFCAAKWLKSDIYLHTGKTSSCEKPVPHDIDLTELESNVLAIHNTKEKIKQRQSMLSGQQPQACYQCWEIENKTPDTASPRHIFSERFKDKDFTKLDLSDTVVPESITIMFDNYCNFVCTYCDPTQSTSWATDLIKNGPYRDIKHDPKSTYLRLGKKDRLSDQEQQYLFEKTLELVIQNLSKIGRLNFLGGEPTLNPKFWEFLDTITKFDVKHVWVEITTNLSRIDRVKKFLHNKENFRKITLNVSIDGTGEKAEFVRKGLVWKEFETNVLDLLKNTDIELNFIGTINSLAMDGLIDLLDWLTDLSMSYPKRISYRPFVVHQPSFQKIDVLPKSLKKHYISAILNWMTSKEQHWSPRTIEGLKSLVVTLESDNPDAEILQNDFRYFVKEFSKRHNNDIECFSTQLVEFINDDRREHGQAI